MGDVSRSAGHRVRKDITEVFEVTNLNRRRVIDLYPKKGLYMDTLCPVQIEEGV